jgi:hypothetical protein
LRWQEAQVRETGTRSVHKVHDVSVHFDPPRWQNVARTHALGTLDLRWW